MFWLVLAVMTGVAALAALWPLSLSRAAQSSQAGESAFYRAQLREIERDVARGQLPVEEAASARTEAARRLIAANAVAPTEVNPSASVWRRRAAAVAILLVVPAISLGAYIPLGQPETPDDPLAKRKADPNSQEAIEFAIAKIEARLAAHPDDARGWEVLAPVYMRLGRFDEAVRAYKEVLRLKGEKDPNLLSSYGESLLAAASGVVTPEARAVFDAVLKIDPQTPMARFYSALAAEQDGDVAKARATYEDLEPNAKGDRPWMIGVRARLEALRSGKPLATLAAPVDKTPEAAPANFSADQLTMIRGMVSGLAQRLADKGGSVEEWARLVRAYTVLQEPDRAKTALAHARKALSADKTALGDLDALAHELGLGS